MYEQIFPDAWKPEFNTARVAGSQLGYKFTEEQKRKLSESHKGQVTWMKGRKHSEESKRKVSVTKTGVKMGKYSQARIAKTAAAMRATKSVLNEDSVKEIRSLNMAGIKHADIAEQVGCSYSAVADIVRNRTFRWVI
jgi:hypothetical protein